MITCENQYYFLSMPFCKYPYIKCPYIGDAYDIELKIGKGKFSGPVTHCMINNIEVVNKRAEIKRLIQQSIDDVIKEIEDKKSE